MRHLWPAFLLLVTFSYRPAHAEVQTLSTYVGGPFNIYINQPNVADNGYRIDCGPSRDNCFLLNRQACDPSGPDLPISFTISRGQSSGLSIDASTSRTVYAFLSTTSSCIYSQISGQIGNNPNLLIGTTSALAAGSVFFTGGTRPFVFPRDIATFNPDATAATTTGKFTTREMLTALGLCSNANGTDTNLGTYFLCVGIDSSNKSGVNNGTSTATTTTTPGLLGGGTSGGDLTAYLQLQADTKAPAPPTALTVTPRNGRVGAEVSFDTTALDVAQINLAYTRDADNLARGDALDANGAPAGCAAWQGNVLRTSINVRNQALGVQNFDVQGLDNDVPYGFCASSQDLLGNASTPTVTTQATPRFECDLFACYPDDLQTGYCGALGAGQLWGGAAAAWLGLRAARRGRRTSLGTGALRLRRGRGRRGRASVLMVLACLALLARPAAAEPQADAESGSNRPRSDSPIETQRSRPRDAEATADNLASKGASPYLVFGDPDREGLNYAPRRANAPRWGAEVRLAPYRPRVGGARVQDIYDLVYARKDGSIFPGRPLSYALGAERFVVDSFGLLGPYVRLGYWRATGATRQCTDAAGAPAPCTAATVMSSTKGNDTASLTFLPITLGAVWRLDPWLQRLGAPVGLAVNFGLDYALWWASSGGRASRYGSHLARGATLGLHLGSQASLQLDALFRRGGSRIHGAVGTHLFGEYQYSYGAALVGKNRRAHLDTTDRHLVTVGLGMRFY